jgi:hypothetical protein
MQLLTAGALLVALLRPLRAGSLAPGFKVQLRWRLPSLRAAGLFLKYAGPIVGVLMSKTVMYSALPATAGYVEQFSIIPPSAPQGWPQFVLLSSGDVHTGRPVQRTAMHAAASMHVQLRR